MNEFGNSTVSRSGSTGSSAGTWNGWSAGGFVRPRSRSSLIAHRRSLRDERRVELPERPGRCGTQAPHRRGLLVGRDAGLAADMSKKSVDEPRRDIMRSRCSPSRAPLRSPCSGPRTAAPAGALRRSRRRTRSSCRSAPSSSRASASLILFSVSAFIWMSANSMSSWMSTSELSPGSSALVRLVGAFGAHVANPALHFLQDDAPALVEHRLELVVAGALVEHRGRHVLLRCLGHDFSRSFRVLCLRRSFVCLSQACNRRARV